MVMSLRHKVQEKNWLERSSADSDQFPPDGRDHYKQFPPYVNKHLLCTRPCARARIPESLPGIPGRVGWACARVATTACICDKRCL